MSALRTKSPQFGLTYGDAACFTVILTLAFFLFITYPQIRRDNHDEYPSASWYSSTGK